MDGYSLDSANDLCHVQLQNQHSKAQVVDREEKNRKGTIMNEKPIACPFYKSEKLFVITTEPPVLVRCAECEKTFEYETPPIVIV